MSKIKNFFASLWRHWYVKYTLVAAIGVVLVGFVDENSVWAHIRNKQRIAELQAEIDRHTARYLHDQAQVRELERNPKAIERIARERYFMKTDDEDIFVLSDDERHPENTLPADETVE